MQRKPILSSRDQSDRLTSLTRNVQRKWVSHLFLSKGEMKTRRITGEGSLGDLFPWFSWFPRFDFLCSLNQSSKRRRKGEEASSITWHAWLSLLFLRFFLKVRVTPFSLLIVNVCLICRKSSRIEERGWIVIAPYFGREIYQVFDHSKPFKWVSHQMLFPTCFYQPNIRLLYPLHSPLWSAYFRPPCLGNTRKGVVQLHEAPDVVISPFGSR